MSITDITLEDDEIMESTELIMKQDIDALVIKMESVEIKTDEEFTGAAEWLKMNKGLQKKVVSHYEADKKAKYEVYKEVTDKIKNLTDLLKKGEVIVKGKLSDYQKELDRKQRIAEEKARKEQEERDRIALEKLKEDNAESGEGEINPDEIDEKNQIDLFAEPVPAPIVSKPSTAGVVFAEVWKWELEDMSKVPSEYLILDEKKINGVVRAMKKDAAIPGIKVYADKQVRA